MLKLGRVTKVKALFVVPVFVFNFDLFKFSAAILEKGLLQNRRMKNFSQFVKLLIGCLCLHVKLFLLVESNTFIFETHLTIMYPRLTLSFL